MAQESYHPDKAEIANGDQNIIENELEDSHRPQEHPHEEMLSPREVERPGYTLQPPQNSTPQPPSLTPDPN